MNILMVCLGNICRSPLADGLLRKKVKTEGMIHFVDSAGTSGHHAGEAPDYRMQSTAKNKGLDISDLRSRKFTVDDFKKFDIIYVMDKSNYSNVISLTENKDDIQKVKLILNEIPNFHLEEVPDPYFGGQEGFEQVYDMLDEATNIIIKKLKNN